MKRLLQLFLAGVFLLSFSAQAGVISPKGIAKWSGGSSVWLFWTSAGDRVDIRLIPKGSGQEPREIATDIKNTGYYLWQIPDLPKDQYTVEIIGNKTDKSAVFNISAWDEAWDERGVWGEFDEDDRSQVTYPLEAAVLDKDEPITLTWDDYRLFLGDKVTIILKRQGKVSDIEVVPNLPNSGTFDFDKGQITECQKGGCYFVIRNNLAAKRSQKISSHTFTFGTPVTDAFTVEKPEDVTSGKELNIGWTGGTDGHRVRIDLNKGGLFYQTIKESVEASEPNNKYAWPVSLSVLAGEDYAIVVTALADGSSGTSDLFTINLDEDKIKVIGPKNLKVKDKSSRKALRWKGIQAAVDIDLYRDSRRFRAIKRDQSKKLFRWTYGDIPIGENYQIRITQTDDDSVYGISTPFAIAAAPDRQAARLDKNCKRFGITGECTTAAIEGLKDLCQYYGIDRRSCTMQVAEEYRNKLSQVAEENPNDKLLCEGFGISEDKCTSTEIVETVLDCEKYCILDHCTTEKIQERKEKVANRIPLICRQSGMSFECEVFTGADHLGNITVDHAPITKAEWDKWENDFSTGISEWFEIQEWWESTNRYCETDEAYLYRLQHFNAYVNDQIKKSFN